MRNTFARLAVVVSLGMVLSAAPASAQQAGLLGGFEVDSSQPIEITSDTLEVRQEDQTAVFAGKVNVIQGAIRLRTERAVVVARETAGRTDVEKITAEGGVFVTNGEGEARGDRGVYDVAAQTITVTGSVALSQGENVLTGERLTINLATGRALMQGGSSQGTGRVRGVFTVPADTDTATQ